MPAHTRNSLFNSLQILIVGGSIAGLACAYTLQKAGHNVIVLEKSNGETRSIGGQRSPPNMTKVLNEWGLSPTLKQLGQNWAICNFLKGGTGKRIGLLRVTEEVKHDLKANFLYLRHGDLHQMLLDLATRQGAEFRYNCNVTQVDSDSVSVTLENGEQLYADAILGADGASSLTRSTVLGQPILEGPSKDLVLRFNVPSNLLQADEDLVGLTEHPDWCWSWLGDSFYFYGSFLNNGREFSGILTYHVKEHQYKFQDNWRESYPIDDFNLDMQKFEPRIRKLLELAKFVTPIMNVTRPYLENLVCERGRVAIVGEAAHPVIPCGRNNAALCLEDAQTLGSLFSRIQYPHQVPLVLNAYEEIRQRHITVARESDQKKRDMFALPPGPAQMQRDTVMALSLPFGMWDDATENVLKVVWGGDVELLDYDGTEQADDWWSKWGSVIDRERPPLTPNIQVFVSLQESDSPNATLKC